MSSVMFALKVLLLSYFEKIEGMGQTECNA